jgi:Domain of unknown function (DUF6379)
MFDRYMICENTVRNVSHNGRIEGFEFGARLPYYRGLGLSMVEEVAVTVDGEKAPRHSVRLTVSDRTYTLDALEAEYAVTWEMGAVVTVTVMKAGGLARGQHQLELEERLRISYMPFPIVGKDSKAVTVA